MNDISKAFGVKVYTKTNEQDLAPLNMFIVNGKIRFNRHTCNVIGLKQDVKIAFIFLGDWYLAITNNVDGYHVRSDGKRSGYSCNASKISRKILMHVGSGRKSVNTILSDTNYEFMGNKVYKIEKILINNK